MTTGGIGRYEIHLTFDRAAAEVLEELARRLHWKTSEIARDPVLGKKNFFYLTKYAVDMKAALRAIDEAKIGINLLGVPLLREKIEHIVHDIRYTPS